MKFLLLGTALFALVGCQSYPKNPTEVALFADRWVVNQNIPTELQPYVDVPQSKKAVNTGVKTSAKQAYTHIYTLRPNESKQAVEAQIQAREKP